MPRKSEKGTDNTRNTGSVKFSQSALYRQGVKGSELKMANEVLKPKTSTGKVTDGKPLKEELPWGVAFSILVVLIGCLTYLGYHALQNMIDAENEKAA